MIFPVHVYRSPGNYVQHGKRYKLLSVDGQEALQAALLDGWHLTLAEAFKAAGEAANVRVKPKADWRLLKKAKASERKERKLAKRAKKLPAPQVVAEPEVNDNAPVTRAELEQKAAELNLKVDRRWSDATLMARIEETLKEPV